MFVCLRGYFRNNLAIFTKICLHVAYSRGSVLLWQGDEITRGWAVFGVSFPIDNALYSIAFGTHTKLLN